MEVGRHLTLDRSSGSAMLDGMPLPVGRRGIAVLAALLDARGRVVPKQDLLAQAWPNLSVGEANLSVQVAALRKALGRLPNGGEWIATVPRIGYRFAGDLPPAESASRPMLAVLPFTELSAVGSQPCFGDGLVEEIITALSRFPTLAVVSRSAGFAQRGKAPQAAASALGVSYLLTGSVQTWGDRLRLTVQLIDGESGRQMKAEQFDGRLSDLFVFQEQITELVVGFVEPGILKAEIERIRRKPPASLDAYELYLQALPLFRATAEPSRAKAIELLETCVSRDPQFATGLAHAAWAYERQDTFGSGLLEADRKRALALAEQALRYGPDDPLVQAICAIVFLNIGLEDQRSLQLLELALQQSPHEATVLSLYAFAQVMVGDVETGRQAYLRALKIAPGALDNYELTVGVAIATLFQGEFEQSASWAQRSIAYNSDWLGAYWMLTAAYVQLGQLERAQATVSRILGKAPAMRLSDIERIGRRYAARFRVVIDALRIAGLPA